MVWYNILFMIFPKYGNYSTGQKKNKDVKNPKWYLTRLNMNRVFSVTFPVNSNRFFAVFSPSIDTIGLKVMLFAVENY